MPEKEFDTVIVWFRRDLRVVDNTALHEAYKSAKKIVPLFVLDDAILHRADTGAARVVFMLDALHVLDQNLRKLGARLILRNGKNPEEVLKALCGYHADAIFFNRDYEPHARERDRKVIDGARDMGKTARSFKDQALFEPEEIKTSEGRPYSVFTPYKKVWFRLPADSPVSTPRSIDLPDEICGEKLPSVDTLKFRTSQVFECGGEDAARDLLEKFDRSCLKNYGEDRNDMGMDATSRLSRHLHFGTISIRTLVHRVRGKSGADAWLNELAWRDFNAQLLWHSPYVENGPLRKQFANISWRCDSRHFNAWREGLTGYPIVDAAMRQLQTEAWMHNRARMIVASFLCKDLLLNWQEGERHFMKLLVDGDLAQNNAGWQWTAGTGADAQPYFRIFNPISQGEKFDPKGAYVRRWVPELKRLPDKVIHKPWMLSAAEQEAVGCVLGKDYPRPIVDHAVQRALALEMYAKATKI